MKHTYSAGMTPDSIIKQEAIAQCPNGYDMHIKSQSEWAAIAFAVNQGIDSHLEGFTRSTFGKDGRCNVHPEELHVLLRRMNDMDDDEARDLRSCILTTLDIEEI